MLEENNSMSVTQTKDSIGVETKYFDILVEGKDNETWVKVTSREAFIIACLEERDGEVFVQCYSKGIWESGDPQIKVPGGYLFRQEGKEDQECMNEKIYHDTGITIPSGARIHAMGRSFGHGEIITPIDLFYTFDWRKTREPREGVTLIEMNLTELCELSLHSKGEDHGFQDVASLQSAQTLFGLWKMGKLKK